MSRIALAVKKSGDDCIILTPGIMPRIASSWKLLPSVISRHGGVAIIAVRQAGIKILGYMLAPLFAVCAAIKVNKKRKIKRVVQYNFNPDAFVFGLWCKLIYRSEWILELEDISKIKLRDLLPNSGVRVLNQWYTCFFQFLSITFCDNIIVPSRKFLSFLPRRKKALVIGGCQKVELLHKDEESSEIKVLLSGSLTIQNGLALFFDALTILENESKHTNLSFVICGIGDFRYVQERLKNFKKIKVVFLGTLSNSDFLQVYRDADVCLVLQDPNGRFGDSKSPSKGYEALCNGKTIIVTDIGDFGLLPDNICYHLKAWFAEELADVLGSITYNDVRERGMAALEYAKENFSVEKIGELLRNFYSKK
jgi:glycosyltransferase involved in cell wall biosynthesis